MRTASGATAVQIVYSSRRGSRDIEYFGPADHESTMTWWTGNSTRKAPTGSGAPRSPNIQRRTARCVAALSSTCILAGSSAGRPPTTCAPNWSSTRCRWPAGPGGPTGPWFIPTGAIRVLDLRTPATGSRTARLHGTRGKLRGQHDDGIVLVDHVTRAIRPQAPDNQSRTRQRDLRMDRSVLQPDPPAHWHRRTFTSHLRSTSPAAENAA